MTSKEREEFKELKDLMRLFLKDRHDPENGWKTDRRVFETQMLGEMKATNTELASIKQSVSCLPKIKEDVQKNTEFRTSSEKGKWSRRDKIAAAALVFSMLIFFITKFV